MEIEEFIKDTLIGIRKGVAFANDAIAADGKEKRVFQLQNGTDKECYINFDIAVTATHEAGTSGSGGVKIHVIEIGGGKEVKTTQESASRIKFSIRIGWFSD